MEKKKDCQRYPTQHILPILTIKLVSKDGKEQKSLLHYRCIFLQLSLRCRSHPFSKPAEKSSQQTDHSLVILPAATDEPPLMSSTFLLSSPSLLPLCCNLPSSWIVYYFYINMDCDLFCLWLWSRTTYAVIYLLPPPQVVTSVKFLEIKCII